MPSLLKTEAFRVIKNRYLQAGRSASAPSSSTATSAREDIAYDKKSLVPAIAVEGQGQIDTSIGSFVDALLETILLQSSSSGVNMAQVITNTGHDDMIHDAVLDYYGRRLATCSSDRTVKIFEIEGENHRLTETLKGHEGAVWSVSWAHPKYGNILASADYDGKVFIWRETPSTSQGGASSFTKIYDFSLHSASVNIISWSPHESGCLLACASSDGSVSVLEFMDNSMDHKIFPAHGMGVNSVSWAPSTVPGSLVSSNVTPANGGVRRFVTGGSDNLLRLWAFDAASQNYKQEGAPLTGHTDWVRDVAWSQSVLQRSYIASASQDKTVRIWTSDAKSGGVWSSKVLPFEQVVWRVSWSLSGNVLAVSGGDNRVSLWKENLRGEWECVKTIED